MRTSTSIGANNTSRSWTRLSLISAGTDCNGPQLNVEGLMDIVASPTSTSAEESIRFPLSNTGNASQPRAQPQSHENPDKEKTSTTPTKPVVVKHL
jgi:hypothetical protein